jgi:hypothetical protein
VCTWQSEVKDRINNGSELKAVVVDPTAAVSPALQGAKHQLERQLKADDLARHLRKRPSVSELEEKGIVDGAFLNRCILVALGSG